jgi:hypothetical protein
MKLLEISATKGDVSERQISAVQTDRKNKNIKDFYKGLRLI